MSEGDSDSVIGLTLAELAFCMLFVVLLFSYLGTPRTEADVVPLAQHESVLDALASAEDEIARLAEELKDRRSSWRPSCHEELPLMQRLLSTVVIEGNDSFQLLPQQVVVDFGGIQETFATELRSAQVAECVHSIAVYFDPDLPTTEYEQGLNRLQRLFYIQRLGTYTGR